MGGECGCKKKEYLAFCKTSFLSRLSVPCRQKFVIIPL